MTQDNFISFILDQLNAINDVRSRKMFGGYGIYAGDHFFAIVSKQQRLYFKTDEQSRQKHIDAGMNCFGAGEKQPLKNYYEVPLEVIENHQRLCQWAEDAILVAEKS